MASKSNIEWTGHTWNPLAGCSVVTPGCKRCYAMRLAKRLGAMGNPLYAGLTQDSNGGAVWTGEMRKAPRHTLIEPLRRKKPTVYFVNSMSDLFHENVPDEWIDEIFAVMALCPHHTFQVLTKRAERMRNYVSSGASARVRDWCYRPERYFSPAGDPTLHIKTGWPERWGGWPLPNVWLGVSTEDQTRADERIPVLLNTPAAIRFISAEPLLAPIRFDPTWLPCPSCKGRGYYLPTFSANHFVPCEPCITLAREKGIDVPRGGGVIPKNRLDWVIVGGESGGGYRPMAPEWAYSLRDQCVAAGVPVFIKQMAGKKPIPADLARREFPVAA